MKTINIWETGIISSEDRLQTKALQSVIDNLEEETTIIFAGGTYLLSTIFLRSDLHFVFEEGCVILGSPDFRDYAGEERVDYPLYQDGSHSYFNPSLFVGKNLRNVSFEGPVKIDMQDSWDFENVRNMYHRGAKCFAFRE